MHKGIGIDLGTTYSSVAVWQYDKVELIANDQGNRATPSFVSFTDSEYLLGDAAKNQVAINPSNTIFDIKRFIGRRFEDIEIQQDKKFWPFKLISVCGKVMIEVKCRGQIRVFTPEEISALILMKMRESAEAYLGSPIRNAVITVPAYFTELQREATRFAGVLAGLNVMRILNEPTAAALAYGLHKHFKDQRNIIIFDLGGGTFDVSVLSVNAGPQFEVLATAGDSHLGGEDFDNRLVSYMIEEFKRKNKRDLSGNAHALYRIRCAVERAKRNLSFTTEAVIEIDTIFEGTDLYVKVTRAKFESLCADLFQKTASAVENVLVDAALSRDEISEVVLVGGSTKIPKIQQIIEKFFAGKLKNQSIVNPEEAVVCGAAIQAALLCDEPDMKIRDFLLVDVVPLSLGIEISGGVMSKIIERGAKLPCKKSQTFTTFTHHQSAVTIQVFEGERSLTVNNKLIGIFNLTGIPLLPCGVPKIEVTFDLDANSILHVTAKEVSSGASHQIKIVNKLNGRLLHSDINRMVDEAKQYREFDEQNSVRIGTRNKLEKYIKHVIHALEEYEEQLKRHYRTMMEVECTNCLQWLEEHQDASAEEFRVKYDHLVSLCSECTI